MWRFVKFGLIVLIVVFFAGCIILVAASFYPNFLKPAIQHLAHKNKQRTLTIDGDLQLKLFPRVTLQLNDVLVSEYQRADIFASIKKIEVSFSLLGLLQKQFVADVINVKGLKATFVRYPDGSTNIDDLLIEDTEPPVFAIDIGRIDAENTQLSIRDNQTQLFFDLNALDIYLQRLTTDTLQQLKIQGRLLWVDFDGLKINPSFFARFEATQLSFADKSLTSGPIFFALKRNIDSPGEESGERFSANVSIVGLSLTENEVASKQLLFKLKMRQSERMLNVNLDTPVVFDFNTQMGALTNIHTAFNFSDPEFLHQPIHGQMNGHIDLNSDSELLQIGLHGEVADSVFKAAIKLQNFTEKRSVIDLSIDQVDLNTLLPNQNLKPESVDQQVITPEHLSETSFFSWLDKLNLKGSIQIGKLSINDFLFSDIALVLHPGHQGGGFDQSVQ